MGTVSPNKGYIVPINQGDTDIWGPMIDGDLTAIDLNFGGRQALNVAGSSNVALTAAQAQNLILNLSGVLTGSINLILPAAGSFYIVNNQATGNFTITVISSASGSTGIVAPQGSATFLYCDATNVHQIQTQDGAGSFGVDSGSASAYVVTLNQPFTLLGSSVLQFTFQATHTSVANATLALDGGSALNLYKATPGGVVQIGVDDIVTGQIVQCAWMQSLNSGAGGFLVLNPSVPTLQGSFLTVNVEANLPDARQAIAAAGISLTDAGAGANLKVAFNPATAPITAGPGISLTEGNIFVIIPNGSTVSQASADGVTWGAGTLPSSQNWTSVAWNGKLFVAINGADATCATSPDGLVWTERTMATP